MLRPVFRRSDLLQQQRRTYPEHLRESHDRLQTGTHATGLQTTEHALADVRLLRDVGEGEAELVADAPRHATDARGMMGAGGRNARRLLRRTRSAPRSHPPPVLGCFIIHTSTPLRILRR